MTEQYTTPPPMTLIDCVKAQTQRLEQSQVSFGHGTHNAHDEAVWLSLWALGLPLDDLDGVANKALAPVDKARISAVINERISSRKPAAYITQEAWLQGVPFHVDQRSIVPRSLIAEPLNEGFIEPWLNEHSTEVLDLCTGNGSLAVLAALIYPEIKVTASDIDTDALNVAHFNVKKHELVDRIKLVASDLFAQLQGRRFDLILCNPPYVNTQSMTELPPEYQAEPPLALAGGADGMDVIKRIIAHSAEHLNEHGVLVLEIGNEIAHFNAAFPGIEAVWFETSAGNEQVCLITRETLIKHATV
jgi:ribosomal protein L3 glutamine methyltransferase